MGPQLNISKEGHISGPKMGPFLDPKMDPFPAPQSVEHIKKSFAPKSENVLYYHDVAVNGKG